MKEEVSKLSVEGSNGLIALFMELEQDLESFRHVFLVNGYWLPKSKLKYHTSWDWLMPVVEKIESLCMWVTIGSDKVDIYWNGGIPVSMPNLTSFDDICVTFDCEWSKHAKPDASSKIEAVWKAVVRFIKWFNEQNKSK